MKMIEEKIKKGTSGILIDTMFDGGLLFRVYDKTVDPWTFVDYKIRHHDLAITIEDNNASFFRPLPKNEKEDEIDSYISYSKEK